MKPWTRWTLWVLCAGYFYILIKVILFKFGPVNVSVLLHQLEWVIRQPDAIRHRLELANFTPLESIEQNLRHFSVPHDRFHLIGNILIFMPCGAFAGLLTRWKAAGALGLSLAVSLALECSQLLFVMGRFDVDDLIMNTFGGLLGYAGYRIGKLAFPEREHLQKGGARPPQAGTIRPRLKS